MDARFPTGKFEMENDVTPAKRQNAIADIAATPAKLRAAVSGLSDAQLDTPYREGGWTVRQLTHHVADSHMNANIRWRLAMTEIEPTIKPYEEKDWAELADAKTLPVKVSLDLLETLHERWVALIRATKETDFARTFRHPEHGVRTLDWMLFLYAWHGRHHVAHITELRKRKDW
jgi:DinB superfamily